MRPGARCDRQQQSAFALEDVSRHYTFGYVLQTDGSRDRSTR